MLQWKLARRTRLYTVFSIWRCRDGEANWIVGMLNPEESYGPPEQIDSVAISRACPSILEPEAGSRGQQRGKVGPEETALQLRTVDMDVLIDHFSTSKLSGPTSCMEYSFFTVQFTTSVVQVLPAE